MDLGEVDASGRQGGLQALLDALLSVKRHGGKRALGVSERQQMTRSDEILLARWRATGVRESGAQAGRS
jgi:hypothetical protein